MDVKKITEKLINEIKKDGNLGTQFKKNPAKVIENVIGLDLPDDIVKKIVDGVNAKINLDKAFNALDKMDDTLDKLNLDKVDDIAGALKKFF